jgi:hypothetical protein
MAILGTNIDVQSLSRVGDSTVGAYYTTLAHSLPATTPDFVAFGMRSHEALASRGVSGLLQVGGNASLLTIGYVNPNIGGSFPTVFFDVVAFKFHSSIR